MNDKSNERATWLREDAERLVRLRHDPDAVPAIMLQLLAQKMGPFDYLTTKREVQAFVVSGELAEATDLLVRAAERREMERQRETQRHQQKIRP